MTNFARWTERARRVIILAEEEARRLGNTWIGAEHLLLAILREEGSVPQDFLCGRGITYEDVLADVKRYQPEVTT